MRKHHIVVAAPTATTEDGCARFTVDITDFTPEAVCAALQASGLTPSDVRTDVIVDLGRSPTDVAVVMYVALLGFLRRHPEQLIVAGAAVPVAQIRSAFRAAIADTDVQPGPTRTVGIVDADYESIPTDAPWTPAEMLLVRNSDVLRWAAPTVPAQALTQLLIISALRQTGPKERLPIMLADTDIDLPAIRSATSDLRSTSTADDRSTIVAAIPVSKRAQYLQQAADVDALVVLSRLGMTAVECPRASRHTRPADPLIVDGATVECTVCDPYPIDMLRLVMDTTGMVADDAADWLMGKATAQPGLLDH